MSWYRVWINDIRKGCFGNKAFFVIPIASLLICRRCQMELRHMEIKGTFGGYLMYFFQGKEIIDKNILTSSFQIPFFWLLLLFIPLFLTFWYPFRDMSDAGIQLLLRSESRSQWWTSKCLWNLSCSVFYFILLYGTAFLFCTWQDVSIQLDITPEAAWMLFSETDLLMEQVENMSVWEFAFIEFLLPLLSVMALNMLEMLLALMIKPIYGLLISITFATAASYATTPFLFCNYANLSRCGMFVDGGLDVRIGILICLAVIIGSFLVGIFVFRTRDILPDYREY